MPELPEVETVRRSIEAQICGKKIESVTVHNDDILDGINRDAFIALLTGNSVTAMERRGKYLIFVLADGNRLLLHLRMTGQFICFNAEPQLDAHCHLLIRFSGGGCYYRDVRRFGRFCLMGNNGKTECGLQKLGPEPFDRAFTLKYLQDGFAGRKCAVKARILDQHFVAGIGNIYADEILFQAKVYPEKCCCRLTRAEIKRIRQAAVEVLSAAIEHRGTTFSDFRDGNGDYGGHQEYLQVFHRTGKPCVKCGTLIGKIKCGGRTTSFCPKCQKKE